MAESDEGRGLVIVFSDGADTASVLRPEAVIATARRTNAVVYAVSTDRLGTDRFLGNLAEAIGGRVLMPDATNLGATFLAIFNEFRQRYLVSYTPRGVPKAGWHQLSVKVTGSRRTVRARPGYVAGP